MKKITQEQIDFMNSIDWSEAFNRAYHSNKFSLNNACSDYGGFIDKISLVLIKEKFHEITDEEISYYIEIHQDENYEKFIKNKFKDFEALDKSNFSQYYHKAFEILKKERARLTYGELILNYFSLSSSREDLLEIIDQGLPIAIQNINEIKENKDDDLYVRTENKNQIISSIIMLRIKLEQAFLYARIKYISDIEMLAIIDEKEKKYKEEIQNHGESR